MRIPGLQGIAVGALCALFAASATATAEIYQWTDASGKIHYTQDLSQVPAAKRPAARAGAAVRKTSRVQTYSTPAAPARARRRRSTGTLYIPFQRQGR